MTRLEHNVQIQRPLAAVYARARAIERYPEFLPGYVKSRIITWDQGRALVERQARVRKKLHQWKSWVRFEENTALHFEHASGPLEGMRVHWQFDALGAAETRLCITHEIHLRRPPFIGRYLERFVYGPQINTLAAQVVTAFKQACETREMS